MQTHNEVSLFIGDKSSDFFHVGLMCFALFSSDVADCGAYDQTRENTRVDLVDFGLQDLDHKHVTTTRSPISLMKSSGCDLISQSTNRGVTRGCMWKL